MADPVATNMTAHQVSPYTGNVSLSLQWLPSEPYTVHLTVRGAGREVVDEWMVSRDLLADGLNKSVGYHKTVRVWPTEDGHVWLSLTEMSRALPAVAALRAFKTNRDMLARFLRDTYLQVGHGEHDMDIPDADLDLWLSGGVS